MEINKDSIQLNSQVQITLTQYSANVINNRNIEFNSYVGEQYRKTDYKYGDCYIGTFWEIMQMFADSFYIGKEIPFYNLKKVD